MFERLLIWLRGYYIISVDYDAVILLINLCNENNIMLNAVRQRKSECYFRISYRDFLHFHDIVSAQSLKYNIHKECGVNVVIEKCKHEWIFLSGAVFFLILIMIAANISLDIAVKSPEALKYISEAEILEIAAVYNIKKWEFIPSLDFDFAEDGIRNSSEYLSFVGVSRDGTRLIIEVKERTMLNAEDEPLPYGNIIAQSEAVIEEIYVLRGTAMVSAGESVAAGQILIAGEEKGLPAAAEGIIKARVNYEGHAAVPLLQEKFSLTGESGFSLYLCWNGLAQLIIAGSSNPPYEYFESADEKIKLMFSDIELPFFLVKRTYYEQMAEQVELTMQDAQDAAAGLAYAQAAAQLPVIGAQIISKDLEIIGNEAEAEAVVRIEAIRSFGIFKPYF